jgi:hypothetical protein
MISPGTTYSMYGTPSMLRRRLPSATPNTRKYRLVVTRGLKTV